MKPLRYWLISINVDLLILCLFYVWRFEGIEQAGNVVVFWLWFVTVVRTLIGFACNKKMFAEQKRPAGFGWYHAITEIALITALVWIGYILLPALYLLGLSLSEAARNREPKTEGGVACN